MCYGGKGSFVTGNVQKKLKLHVVSPFLVPLWRGGGINNFKVGISPFVSY